MKPTKCTIYFSLFNHNTSTCFGLASSPSSGGNDVYSRLSAGDEDGTHPDAETCKKFKLKNCIVSSGLFGGYTDQVKDLTANFVPTTRYSKHSLTH
jgi:hypothetical protein